MASEEAERLREALDAPTIHSGQMYGCVACYRDQPCRERTIRIAATKHLAFLEKGPNIEAAARTTVEIVTTLEGRQMKPPLSHFQDGCYELIPKGLL